MRKNRLAGILVFCIFISNASAANDSIEKLNESMSKGDIKSIVDEARNSSGQLFNQFYNSSEALSSMPGLESMLRFIDKLLQIFFDIADKIAGFLP
jgi:hypothetical protein